MQFMTGAGMVRRSTIASRSSRRSARMKPPGFDDTCGPAEAPRLLRESHADADEERTQELFVPFRSPMIIIPQKLHYIPVLAVILPTRLVHLSDSASGRN